MLHLCRWIHDAVGMIKSPQMQCVCNCRNRLEKPISRHTHILKAKVLPKGPISLLCTAAVVEKKFSQSDRKTVSIDASKHTQQADPSLRLEIIQER